MFDHMLGGSKNNYGNGSVHFNGGPTNHYNTSGDATFQIIGDPHHPIPNQIFHGPPENGHKNQQQFHHNQQQQQHYPCSKLLPQRPPIKRQQRSWQTRKGYAWNGGHQVYQPPPGEAQPELHHHYGDDRNQKKGQPNKQQRRASVESNKNIPNIPPPVFSDPKKEFVILPSGLFPMSERGITEKTLQQLSRILPPYCTLDWQY